MLQCPHLLGTLAAPSSPHHVHNIPITKEVRPIRILLRLLRLRIVLKLDVTKAPRLLRVVIPRHVHIQDVAKLQEPRPQRLSRSARLVIPAHMEADGALAAAVPHAAPATTAAPATHDDGGWGRPRKSEARKRGHNPQR